MALSREYLEEGRDLSLHDRDKQKRFAYGFAAFFAASMTTTGYAGYELVSDGGVDNMVALAGGAILSIIAYKESNESHHDALYHETRAMRYAAMAAQAEFSAPLDMPEKL